MSDAPAAHHHEHHEHGHGNFAESNKKYFDEHAAKYDDVPGAVELASRISEKILKKYPFDEERTTVLDYACGTGLISRNLAPHTKSIVGVDISQGMVDQYNLRVSNQGIPPEEMKAVRAELKGDDNELGGAKFDVVVCSMAYHHFDSIDDTTRVLAHFVRPGGRLMVADLYRGDDALIPEQYKHVAHHHGIDTGELKDVFAKHGIVGFEHEHAATFTMHGKEMSAFLAVGTKQAA
ncbi:S-adenosyl-L-methionine-dependent methyltransferase [Gloeophyllum trabeum ATCC 11539]|uniref:S-adenosyl-L-methionine-dependent methyltransferase n=1 Tax=Gloeophyllum trabeum (strain ATCC 11539 / FP-39264 / Madison 617) TaxID=670483 RepID=S7PTD7_GLOTA|nr:S-adenosyl-L-methionine-dependent methyltransferase [Gloeophyllum trabeum ATCC 11539]EPQ50567.1 S-adenosyl-L-methionine-dependent methyltransferase [Gloeophyllum trabeum ATCC 11539]